MKRILSILVACAAPALGSDKLLQEISLAQLAAAGGLKSGTLIADPGQPETLKVENKTGGPLTAHLFDVSKPKIGTAFYRIEGEVRHEAVESVGYLEMWNHFGAGMSAFSRTLADGGPMGGLRGTSSWRTFILPFNATGTKNPPERLEVNVQLPGKGTVFLRSLRLIEMTSFGITATAAAPRKAWWTDRTAGWVGGIGGGLLGCLGTYLEWAAARGRARAFVLGASRALLVVGILSTIAGLVAAALGQPYEVWYILLLGGILCGGISATRLGKYEARYRDLELRRMAALDAA